MLNPAKNNWALTLPAIVTVISVTLSGCSTTPKPVAEISAAKTALTSAESEEAIKYAPVRMDRARQKLKRAQYAISNENYKEAKRLAMEAQADAELAKAITAKTETDQAVTELENSIKVLREEIMRARKRQR
jgi:predicted outer membrane protein